MTKTFTLDDLIRYVYGETQKNETEEIENSILCDNTAHKEFDQLILMKQSLDKIKVEPSNHVVSKILNYSRSFEMPELTD